MPMAERSDRLFSLVSISNFPMLSLLVCRYHIESEASTHEPFNQCHHSTLTDLWESLVSDLIQLSVLFIILLLLHPLNLQMSQA